MPGRFKHDSILSTAILGLEVPEPRKEKDYFNYLVKAVVYQQLSGKAAQTIYNRFLELFGGKTPSAAQLLKTDNEKLRAVGLSGQKASYVRNIADFASRNSMANKDLDKMPDEELLGYLSSIKGVGKWTVEMMMIFAMGREDVFPHDDLAIQQAMTDLYKLDATKKKSMIAEMINIADRWKPHRSLATRYLWAWKDEKKRLANLKI